MDHIFELVAFISNAYFSRPRDPVLIARYGAVRGAIAFGIPGLFLIGVVMLMLPDLSQGSAAMRPLFEIIGIVANWTLIASAIAMLISMLFMLRLAYTYIDPDHFDYQ